LTAFTTNDLPPGIDTVEKLSAWCSSVLNYLYFDSTVVENSGAGTRPAQSAPFEITAADPIQWRLISRQSLRLNKNWISSGKIWNYVEPLGSSNIPTDFKS
jgi:hypothetical protein